MALLGPWSPSRRFSVLLFSKLGGSTRHRGDGRLQNQTRHFGDEAGKMEMVPVVFWRGAPHKAFPGRHATGFQTRVFLNESVAYNRRTNGATLALFKESSLTSKSSPILRRSRASLNPPSTRETPRGRRRPSRPKSQTRRNARGIPLHRVKNNVLFSRVIVLRRCQGAPLCGGRVTTCCEAIDSLI